MTKPIIYASNPCGPMIYYLWGFKISEAEAWRKINAGEAEYNDEGVTDWYALSNGLGGDGI